MLPTGSSGHSVPNILNYVLLIFIAQVVYALQYCFRTAALDLNTWQNVHAFISQDAMVEMYVMCLIRALFKDTQD